MTIKNRERTDFLIIHCAATTARQDIGVKTINGWHLQRRIFSDRGLSGYHFVIRRSGLIELGRDLMAIGAHCLGFNARSVGTCLVGGARKVKPGETPEWADMVSEDNFTAAQYDTLTKHIAWLQMVFPSALVGGHKAFDPGKACPSFDVWAWQQARFGNNDKLKVLEALAKGENKVPETTAED